MKQCTFPINKELKNISASIIAYDGWIFLEERKLDLFLENSSINMNIFKFMKKRTLGQQRK